MSAVIDAVAVNLNSMATMTLTASGAQLYNSYYQDMPAQFRPARVKLGSQVRMELWHAMRIFGHMMYNGMPEVPFQNNTLHIEPL